jgi:acetyltransferase-like isoleucine patch superfamily enzyme
MPSKWKAKVILVVYYILISKLPSSRFWKGFNTIRCWYACHVLGILEITEGALIDQNVYIGDASQVMIGEGARINENVFIQGARIGRNVLIAPGCVLLSKDHKHSRIDIPIALQGETDPAPVVIQDGAWLGRNVVVKAGVTIGKNAIIGACAFVNEDIPENSVFGGVPAKFIRFRE